MEVSLENINQLGFVFHKYPTELLNTNNKPQLIENFKNYISSLISIDGEKLYADFDKIEQNQEIKPHFHIIPGSFQVVIWLPKSDFEGRYFLFGRSEELYQVKPQVGFMCFMKPNSPEFIHGVSPLLSKNPVESLGFSSMAKRVHGNQDIFVPSYQIQPDIKVINNLINA